MISCLLITTLQNCFTGEMTSTEISSSLDAITSFQHNTLSHDLLTLCRQAHWNKRKNTQTKKLSLIPTVSCQLVLGLLCLPFLSNQSIRERLEKGSEDSSTTNSCTAFYLTIKEIELVLRPQAFITASSVYSRCLNNAFNTEAATSRLYLGHCLIAAYLFRFFQRDLAKVRQWQQVMKSRLR